MCNGANDGARLGRLRPSRRMRMLATCRGWSLRQPRSGTLFVLFRWRSSLRSRSELQTSSTPAPATLQMRAGLHHKNAQFPTDWWRTFNDPFARTIHLTGLNETIRFATCASALREARALWTEARLISRQLVRSTAGYEKSGFRRTRPREGIDAANVSRGI